MRRQLIAAYAAALIFVAGGAFAADPATVSVPLDSETTLANVGVGCTGIGETKTQERWMAYPVRVEFADAHRAYLAGEIATVSDPAGQPLFTVSCEGPWLLLRFPDARGYKVQARLTDQPVAPRSATVKSPARGQSRFVITFPDAQ